MYIPKEIWIIIKLYLFHNIKYGKHNKKNKYIKQYNKIMKILPIKEKMNIYGEYSIRLRYEYYYFEKFYVYLNNSRSKYIEIFEHQML